MSQAKLDDLEVKLTRLTERVNQLETQLRQVKRVAENAECAHVSAGNY